MSRKAIEEALKRRDRQLALRQLKDKGRELDQKLLVITRRLELEIEIELPKKFPEGELEYEGVLREIEKRFIDEQIAKTARKGREKAEAVKAYYQEYAACIRARADVIKAIHEFERVDKDLEIHTLNQDVAIAEAQAKLEIIQEEIETQKAELRKRRRLANEDLGEQ